MKEFAKLVLLLVVGVFLSQLQNSQAAETEIEMVERYSLKHQAVVRYELISPSGLPVRYYLANKIKKAPLLLFIQGSGCGPAVVGNDGEGGARVFDFLPTAASEQFNAMVVEKPYFKRPSSERPMDVNGCSKIFNQHFSYENWLEVLDTAYAHALTQTARRLRGRVILGVSEGAVMAAGLARKNKDIDAVALIGASNGNQLFDFIDLAYKRFDLESIDQLVKQVRDIQSAPKRVDQFAWGHTYQRWASFLKVSTSDLLSRDGLSVYLVSGTADQSVPIASAEYLYAQLVVQGVDVSFRRIKGANHSLLLPNQGFAAINDEYALIKTWFLQQ